MPEKRVVRYVTPLCILFFLCIPVHLGLFHTDDHSTQIIFKDFIKWIKEISNSEHDEQALRNIITIVLSRLGAYHTHNYLCLERDQRRSEGHGCDSDCAKMIRENWILRNVIGTNSTEESYTDILKDVSKFRTFCRSILHVGLASSHRINLCVPAAMEMWYQEQDVGNSTRMVALVKRNYQKDARLATDNSNRLLPYVVDSFANRFQCIKEKDIRELPEDQHEMMIVFSIVKGYNFVGDEDACPADYIRHLMSQYGHQQGIDLPRILHSLLQNVHGNYGNQQDAALNENQRDLQGYQPQAVLASMRLPGTNLWNMNMDIVRRYEHNEHGENHLNNEHGWNLKNTFLHIDTHLYQSTHKQTSQCMSARDLYQMFNIKPSSQQHNALPTNSFLDMCPVILDLMLKGHTNCWHQFSPTHLATRTTLPSSSTTSKPPASTDGILSSSSVDIVSNTSSSLNETNEFKEETSRLHSYLFGSLSTLVISLFSMFGAVFMKLSRVNIRRYLMATMLSLAVGCLVADAALHLLPEIITNAECTSEENVLFPSHLRKMCAFLASIYAFFILEILLSTKHDHSHGDIEEDTDNVELKYVKAMDDNNLSNRNIVRNKLNNESPTGSFKDINAENFQPKVNNTDAIAAASAGEIPHLVVGHRTLKSSNSNASDRISIHDVTTDIKALAWMIIIGDGIHNFADGLAIGAAYAVNFTKGLSLSITVLCHEVPHELGDFAVLISTGMSIKRALLLNFLSSLTAFAGLYVGLVLGEQEEASKWIFSVGAGMFLYVALTDLIPECKELFKKTPTKLMFIGQNIGLLFGYAIMLLLAMFEDRMEIEI